MDGWMYTGESAGGTMSEYIVGWIDEWMYGWKYAMVAVLIH